MKLLSLFSFIGLVLFAAPVQAQINLPLFDVANQEAPKPSPDARLRAEEREAKAEQLREHIRQTSEIRVDSQRPAEEKPSTSTSGGFVPPKFRDMAERLSPETRSRFEALLRSPEAAKAEFERRLKNADALDARLQNLTRLSGTKTASELEARKQELESLRERILTGVASTTDPAQIAEIVKAARGYAFTVPKAAIIAAADRELAVVTQLELLSEKLAARAGADAVAAFDEHVANAKASANAAVSAVSGLETDGEGEKETILTALKDARAKIADAHKSLGLAKAEAAKIVADIKGSTQE